jgi:hypothetical protein
MCVHAWLCVVYGVGVFVLIVPRLGIKGRAMRVARSRASFRFSNGATCIPLSHGRPLFFGENFRQLRFCHTIPLLKETNRPNILDLCR